MIQIIQKSFYTFLLFTLVVIAPVQGVAEEAKVQKITDNVYSIYLNHYNSLVVIGDKGVLMVDPASTARASALNAEIAKLTPLPVTHVILSHEHYDHVGGTEQFPEAKIYAQRHTQPVFRVDVSGRAPKKVDEYFDDKASIMMGDTKVDLYHYGAGDGVGTAVIHLPNEGVVYSADMYEVNQITDKRWLADSNFVGSRSILNNMAALNPEYAITAHSESIDPKHLVAAAEFYNELYDAVAPTVLETMDQGFVALINALETLPQQVELEKYKDYKNYDHLPYHTERMVLSIFHGG